MQELTDMMQGSFEILRKTYAELINLKPREAIIPVAELSERLREVYNKKEKKDTLLMDVLAEQRLAGSENYIGNLDLVAKVLPGHEGVWITEERGIVMLKPINPLSNTQLLIGEGTPVFISDPIDQSRQIESMAKEYEGKFSNFGQIFDAELSKRGALARVDAPNTSVTMLKNNQIMYTMILNLLTREVYIGSERGVFSGDIEQAKTIDDISKPLQFKTVFNSAEDNFRMICYAYGEKYIKNLAGTNLSYFIHEEGVPQPVGPLRFSYLLADNGSDIPNIGLIAYNGEKVQELLPSISIAYFSKGGLHAWKLFCKPDYREERAGKDMTPHLRNSLFKGYMRTEGIEYTHMNRHTNPNNFRDTVVITPNQNYAVQTMMRGMENHNPEERQSVRII
jgi:hypothetical protein